MYSPSRLFAGALVAVSALLTIVLTLPARAADDDGPTTTSSSSTTEADDDAGSTTSTTEADDDGSSTTTRPGADGTTSSTSSTTTSTTLAPGTVPPEVQAMIDAYPRTPAGSTGALVDALAALPAEVARAGFGRFPVAGAATWTHDWLFARHEPAFHVHEGTDVFAARGTEVLAPTAGTAHLAPGPVGGLAVQVVQPDGTFWYLAHLDEARVVEGEQVVPGTVVGTVGDTGNAKGGSPHVHVEVHPHGGPALDPKPLLDAYRDEALTNVPAVIAAYRAALLRAGRN